VADRDVLPTPVVAIPLASLKSRVFFETERNMFRVVVTAAEVLIRRRCSEVEQWSDIPSQHSARGKWKQHDVDNRVDQSKRGTEIVSEFLAQRSSVLTLFFSHHTLSRRRHEREGPKPHNPTHTTTRDAVCQSRGDAHGHIVILFHNKHKEKIQ
jgi:hypothetical protein